METQLLLALLVRFLLVESPAILDMINNMRAEGRTEVTDADLAMLEGKWGIPAEEFFKKEEEPT